MIENVKELAHQLAEWGVLHEAQDVYFLPNGIEIAIFFRTRMQWTLYIQVSAEIGERLIFHFKFIGGMDVGERQRAQLGATTYLISKTKQRLRLSPVGGSQNRESLVIRFLHRFGERARHFFFPRQLNEIGASCQRRGLCLFSKPVGSGKTTTMYCVARQRSDEQQVIAVEDPIEIEEKQFLQLQTNEKIQLTYKTLIKVCLYHHPDILIIGEIRDGEMAQTVIRAALTGHTIFITVRTRDLLGVQRCLIELGDPEHGLTECLQGIIYQQILTTTINKERVAEIPYNYFFFREAVIKSSWQKNLRRAWVYGFITKKTYFQAIE